MLLQPHIAELEVLMNEVVESLTEKQQDCIRYLLRQQGFRRIDDILNKWQMDRRDFEACKKDAMLALRSELAAVGVYSVHDFLEE